MWTPNNGVDLKKLESVQHKFFSYPAYKMDQPFAFDQHDYSEISKQVKLCSIKFEHIYHDLMFAKKVKINGVPCNKIVIIFKDRTVSYSLRDFRPIFESGSAKDYDRYASVNRIRRKYNKLPISIRNVERISLFKIRLREHITQYK